MKEDRTKNVPKETIPDRCLDKETTNEVYPFTIFSPKEKYVLMVILSLIGFWSTVSSPIYFPALPTISEYFGITASVTNLSVVAYLLFQGIMPTFTSNFADTFGRRPVIIISMLVYIASCVGLSQTNVYWLLAVLRCVQAAGIGPVISISSGVSGDVCTAADRGGFVGMVSGMQLSGNAFGGLMGAGLIHEFGWRGIFIFLAIGSGVTLIFISLCLPETLRSMVGNGSIRPKHFVNVLPIYLLAHYKKRLTNDESTLKPKIKLNLLSPFKILLHIETICVLLPPGIKFASWTMVLTSITKLEGDGYNYGVLKVGYMYLPQGIACLLGSMVTGKVLNWYYRHCKSKYDNKYGIDSMAVNEDTPKFNILSTRIFVCITPAVLHFMGLIIFGWCLQYKQNIASIIVSTCMVSYSSSSFIAICTTLLVDLHPENASTSASLMNLIRCCLAALGTGVLSKMTSSMGLGGCYTFWAAIGLLSDLLLVYVAKRKRH